MAVIYNANLFRWFATVLAPSSAPAVENEKEKNSLLYE